MRFTARATVFGAEVRSSVTAGFTSLDPAKNPAPCEVSVGVPGNPRLSRNLKDAAIVGVSVSDHRRIGFESEAAEKRQTPTDGISQVPLRLIRSGRHGGVPVQPRA
jgi:hypothetical protein